MSTINLLPDDYLKRRGQRHANILCLILFVIVMFGVGVAYLITARNFHRTLEVSQRIDDEYTEAARKLEQMRRLEERKSELWNKADATAALQERMPRSYILAVLTNARPKDTSLTEISLVTTKPEIPPKATKFEQTSQKSKVQLQATRVVLTVTGLAGTDVQVAKYISNLAGNPLIANVDLIFSQEIEIDDFITVRQFKITVELIDEARIPEMPFEGTAEWLADVPTAEANEGADA